MASLATGALVYFGLVTTSPEYHPVDDRERARRVARDYNARLHAPAAPTGE